MIATVVMAFRMVCLVCFFIYMVGTHGMDWMVDKWNGIVDEMVEKTQHKCSINVTK